MKKILTVFTFLIASFFSTSSKSDSIYDIDIEGIKLGESVFKYLSKETINYDRKRITTKYKSDRYKRVRYAKSYGYSGNLYFQMGFHYNKQGKLGSISGTLDMRGKTFDQCIGRSLSIIDEIKQKKVNARIIGNAKKSLKKIDGGKRTLWEMILNDGRIRVQCNFPKTNVWAPSLQVMINTRDFENWLRNEAYK